MTTTAEGRCRTALGSTARSSSIYANDVGIKPLDVLKWATYNGAQLSGHKVGEIREGMLADLVAVDGDPSTDITILENADNIKAVMIDGRFVRDELASSGRDQDGVRT